MGTHDGTKYEQAVTEYQTFIFFATSPQEDPMDNDNSFIGGYAVPVDPMDDLQCDSCQ
ncbi:hypothetical protein RCH11_001942 [Glaciihabitans sp. GrIS 2.15]|nr:hypothetical protein [Glaciihabitans sp. GrIS 2.15]